MSKELYVSSTPHETRVGLVEDDQLAEVYFERENEYTLAGSIYKGRVTRVLPGMQSAFVDIGLERDAFLYVSDFLDFAGEDDEEEFGEVPVKTQFAEVKQSAEPAFAAAKASPETVEAEPEQMEEDEAEEEEDAEADAPMDEAEAASLGEGARRWRGRRRRRGRRGGRERSLEPHPAGAPAEPTAGETEMESAETEPAEAEAPPAAQDERLSPPPGVAEKEPASYQGMPADYTPIVLPGESIARYIRGPEGEPREERAPEPRQEFHSRRDDFRNRRHGRERDRDRGRERTYERPPRSAEDFALPKNYTPIVLPGESISKYRQQHASAVSPEAPAPVANAQATPETGVVAVSRPSETAMTGFSEGTAPSSRESEALEATEQVSEGREVAAGGASAEAAKAQPGEPSANYAGLPEPGTVASQAGRAEAAFAPPAETFEDAEVPLRPRTRQREDAQEEVGSVSAISAAEGNASATLEPRHESETAPAEAAEPVAAEQAPAHQAESYSPQGGPVVHEELEGEETDMPSYTEHFDTADHQETEERVYSRQGDSANGEILSETVREAGEEHALRESEYDFEEDEQEEGDEYEESEMLADGEEEDEGEDFEAQPPAGDNGRAELRAPSATAGYQQRVGRVLPERPGRDHRPRRGGRPMRPRRDAQRHAPLISELLKEGQEILVQIAKEPIGKKGARITSHIALPGRFLVFMPTVNHVGVSRKISSEDERQRLKRIVASERENGHGGFIVRTAAAGIKEDELRADIRFLKHLWSEIRNRADNGRSPALIYHDLNLVERILRDQVTQDFSQIWVDSEAEYERTVRFASRFQPDLVRRIKLYTKPTPLFEQFGLQEEINKSLKSKVWLKSGGYIVINQTEALVAIDINTGKYVGKTARLEDTIVKTNCDAVKEIVRQIRLRDLGGIIVIDFIDMDERKNRQKVMQTLEEALKADRAPSKVLQFNDFGLVAITRKRVKQSLERTLGAPCPYCSASGFVKSVTTVCNEIYAELRKIRPHLQGNDITLRVNPEVAKELKANNGRWLSEMEDLAGRTILIKSDPLVHQEQFDIQF